MDESSDGSGAVTRSDSTGLNNLTDNNTVPSDTGIISNAAKFTYTNAEYLSIADGSQTGLDFTGNVSFSFWIYLTQLPSSTAQKCQVITKLGPSQATQAYQLFIDQTTNKLMFFWRDGSNNSYYSFFECDTAFVSGDLNKWKHIVVTITLSPPSAIFYIDGSAKTDTTIAADAPSWQDVTTQFSIGGPQDGYYDGRIDEVGIWSRVITPTEVTSLYNSGAGLQYPFSSSSAVVHNLLLMGCGT